MTMMSGAAGDHHEDCILPRVASYTVYSFSSTSNRAGALSLTCYPKLSTYEADLKVNDYHGDTAVRALCTSCTYLMLAINGLGTYLSSHEGTFLPTHPCLQGDQPLSCNYFKHARRM